jgi:TetR/AcrR family transcriptional regulator
MQTQRQISVRKAAQAGQATVVQSAILEAAETLFAKRGLQGTRVRDIADMAGVNVATLYNYYTNKDALYEAVLDRGIQPLIDIMKQFSAEASQGVEAAELIDAIMAHLQKYPNISRLIYLEAISDGEYLQKLSSQWLRPLLQLQRDLLTAMGLESSPDNESIHPLLSSLFIQLSFGHFAIAPLLKEVYGQDPTSPHGIAQQKRLIAFLAGQLFQFPLYTPSTVDSHLAAQEQPR